MRIRHVQTLFSPEHGGPTHSLTNYCCAQVGGGHEVSLVVLEGFPGASPANRLADPIKQYVLPIDYPAKLGRCKAMAPTLASLSAPDVYHVHGSWHRALTDAVDMARKQKVPIVLEMMGSFSAYELSRKPVRKWLARRLYQDRVLHTVDCIHVNSIPEAHFIRNLGFNTPIAVIPVGVPIENHAVTDVDDLLQPGWSGSKWMLFLARIHPTKGIDLLLPAWKQAMANRPDWRLLIAGYGEPDYVQTLTKLARQLGIHERCVFTGPISAEQKNWAYANAFAYILPSRQENFGNTVAEALSWGCPAATTTGTPWRMLEENRCGWIAEPSVESIGQMLIRMADTSSDERLEMGIRGRQLVEAKYSLDAVNNSLLRLYRWLLGGAKPTDILFES